MTLWATLPVSSFAVYDSFLRAIDSSGFAALTTEFLCRVPCRPFKCQDQWCTPPATAHRTPPRGLSGRLGLKIYGPAIRRESLMG